MVRVALHVTRAIRKKLLIVVFNTIFRIINLNNKIVI